MSVLAILGFVLIVSNAAVGTKMDLKTLQEIGESCKKEFGITGSVKDIKSEGASREEKCFLACSMTKRMVMRNDGTFDADQNREHMETLFTGDMRDAVVKASDFCLKEVKPVPDDRCETAYKVLQCKREQIAAAKKS